MPTEGKMGGGTGQRLLFAGLLAAALLPATAGADVIVLDMTRANIDMDYNDATGWDLGVHDEFHDIAYGADEVLFYANETARRLVPDDPAFAFLGAAPGDTVWVLTAVFDPGRMSVGVSAESIEDGTFASYFEPDPRVNATATWVKVTVKEVRGPGEVSVWQNDYQGNPVVWAATSQGLDDSSAVFVISGRDEDYNWCFTQPGIYEIDVVASAYLGPDMSNPTSSEVVTYTFGVEATEP